VVVLDIGAVGGFCDYFVIASANSLRQVNAIAHAIDDDMAALGRKPLSRIPSEDASGWIAADYGSVVAHVFYKPQREFYALERLWLDAPRLRIPRSLRRSST
jgi:ribosome-associated protein